jgi:hypothetical protein
MLASCPLTFECKDMSEREFLGTCAMHHLLLSLFNIHYMANDARKLETYFFVIQNFNKISFEV